MNFLRCSSLMRLPDSFLSCSKIRLTLLCDAELAFNRATAAESDESGIREGYGVKVYNTDVA
jgi:hypothetical protein